MLLLDGCRWRALPSPGEPTIAPVPGTTLGLLQVSGGLDRIGAGHGSCLELPCDWALDESHTPMVSSCHATVCVTEPRPGVLTSCCL